MSRQTRQGAIGSIGRDVAVKTFALHAQDIAMLCVQFGKGPASCVAAKS